MATLESRLRDLASVISVESKRLAQLVNNKAADNAALQTVAKGNLLAAINEVYGMAQAAAQGNGAKINDASTSSSVETYSVAKILSAIAAAITKIDTDNDGKVNAAAAADTVPWTGVSNKPAQFPPAGHDASLVTSGVLDIARIPVLPSQNQVISSGDLTALSTSQQNNIAGGTIVTTTDGSRYVYSGAGTKTVASSYVLLADVTPDWSTISSKPTTLAGYGITNAQVSDATLTGLAGLVTAANQMVYATGVDTFAMATLSTFARSILDDVDAPTVRATIGALSTTEIGNPDTDFSAVFTAGLL